MRVWDAQGCSEDDLLGLAYADAVVRSGAAYLRPPSLLARERSVRRRAVRSTNVTIRFIIIFFTIQHHAPSVRGCVENDAINSPALPALSDVTNINQPAAPQRHAASLILEPMPTAAPTRNSKRLSQPTGRKCTHPPSSNHPWREERRC